MKSRRATEVQPSTPLLTCTLSMRARDQDTAFNDYQRQPLLILIHLLLTSWTHPAAPALLLSSSPLTLFHCVPCSTAPPASEPANCHTTSTYSTGQHVRIRRRHPHISDVDSTACLLLLQSFAHIGPSRAHTMADVLDDLLLVPAGREPILLHSLLDPLLLLVPSLHPHLSGHARLARLRLPLPGIPATFS